MPRYGVQAFDLTMWRLNQAEPYLEFSPVTSEECTPVNVCLYVAIPEQEQFRKHAHPLAQRVKSTIKHVLNDVLTIVTGKLHLEAYHYKIASSLSDNSNRGDIAIRMAVRQQLAAAFAPQPVTFTELGWGALTDVSVAEINKSCQLFVIGGGGYVFINGDGSAGARLADVPHLLNLKCPVVAYGIGLNRLMHEDVHALNTLPENTCASLRSLSTACAAVSVRDTETLELFTLHGDKPAALIGDPVLFLHGPRPPARQQTTQLSIGINLAAHGWRALKVLKPLLSDIVGLLKAFQARHDVEWVYLLHHDFERPIANYLRRRGISLRIVDGGPTELLEAYTQLDLVVCQMLHSCIFAANANVPFLNIAYDRKNIAFCTLMDVSQYCVPHSQANADALQQKLETLLRNRAEVASTIADRKTSLRPAFTGFLEKIVDISRRRAPGGE